MRIPISIVIACALVGPGVFLSRSARAQDAGDNTYVPLGPQDLQALAAPVALYPDAMLAQIMVACTYPNDIAAATQYLDAGSDPNAIDDQGWDLSVAGVARYPDLLHYMAANADWMNSLGAAFMNQESDVMAAVQALRSQAMAAGNLVSNDQQQVIVDSDGTIEIIPTNPQDIYPPIYDPNLVYQPEAVVAGGVYVPLIRFWHGIPCGAWLHHDIDWHDHSIYVGSWGVNRPWWGHDRAGGPLDYTHDRPGLYASNGTFSVNVHNRVVDVRGGAWTRQMHDPQKPMPRLAVRPGARLPSARSGTGYEGGREPAQHPGAAISNYNHGSSVGQQSARGRESREKGGFNSHPSTPVNVPSHRAAVPSEGHSNPAPQHSEPAYHAPPARGGASSGYGNGAEASRESSRGASSRGSSSPSGRR